MTKKIPPELQQLVLELHGQGQDSEHISGLLWREHQVEVSSRAVRTLCKKHRDEQTEIARGVVREKLRRCILPAVETLSGVLTRARRLERDARKRAQNRPPAQARARRRDEATQFLAQDRQMKAANLILHYIGVDEAGSQHAGANVDAQAALLDRLERAARELRKSREQDAPPAPPTNEPEVH